MIPKATDNLTTALKQVHKMGARLIILCDTEEQAADAKIRRCDCVDGQESLEAHANISLLADWPSRFTGQIRIQIGAVLFIGTDRVG